jgi:hypothetical protein
MNRSELFQKFTKLDSPPSAAKEKKRGNWGHPTPRQGNPAPLQSTLMGDTPIGANFSKERLSALPFSCRLRRQKERKEVIGDTPNPSRETLHPFCPQL